MPRLNYRESSIPLQLANLGPMGELLAFSFNHGGGGAMTPLTPHGSSLSHNAIRTLRRLSCLFLCLLGLLPFACPSSSSCFLQCWLLVTIILLINGVGVAAAVPNESPALSSET